MVESSDEPNLLSHIRYSASRAHASYISPNVDDRRSAIPLDSTDPRNDAAISSHSSVTGVPSNDTNITSRSADSNVAEKNSSNLPPPAPPPLEAGDGVASTSVEQERKEKEPNIFLRFYEACKEILLSSWMNLLLVFVPVGIAVEAAGVDKTIVFAVNAIAIIPLAGLLSHATESVASELGDTIGALMNVTFGNAVELIIL